jgi:hypothetical protein
MTLQLPPSLTEWVVNSGALTHRYTPQCRYPDDHGWQSNCALRRSNCLCCTTNPTSPSTPCAAPTTLASTSVPHTAPTIPPAASSVAPVSPLVTQPMLRVLPVGAVPVSPVVHLHPMRTRGAVGFLQPKLYVAATLTPIPKSVRVALADPNWQATMEEEYVTLMSNDTWDLVSRPVVPMLSLTSGSSSTSSRPTRHLRGTRPARFFAGSRSVPTSIMMRLSVPL